jgi:hypothetical protein
MQKQRYLLWLLLCVCVVSFIAGAIRWWPRATSEGPASNGQDALDHEAQDRLSDLPAGPALFRDVAEESGVRFTYRNGEEAQQFTILEVVGGGVALLDYDGDGLLDIFLTGGGWFDGPDKKTLRGHPCKLFRNLGNWKFADVSKQAGLDLSWPYNHGADVADYDRDGWPDLVVTSFGRLILLHNEPDGKGGRRFVDVTEAVHLKDDSWSTSTAWADLDGDGYPDLYVCHYLDWSFKNNPICEGFTRGVKRDVCEPQRFKPLKHTLFLNAKGKKGREFRDVSDEHHFEALGRGLGVVSADLNDDGRPDLFVANDGNNRFLFFNRGNGVLEERGLLSGVAVDEHGNANGSMGVDAGDYNGCGRPSLWVTNFQDQLHGLYENLGNELFNHHSRASGIAAMSVQYVGFGTGFFDFDNDGWEDLIIANGHVMFHPMRGGSMLQKPVLLHNGTYQGRRYFRDVSSRGGPFFQVATRGRGVAIGDLDNDGWPDMVISHINAPVAVLRNEFGPTSTNRWLGAKLVGRDHRDIVGSTIILEGSTRSFYRYAKGGGSYLSARDQRILFGLPAGEQVRKVTVKWSWGESQSWENLEPNSYWELREGEPAAKRINYTSR